jgi:phage/plasmid-associated DNA primase
VTQAHGQLESGASELLPESEVLPVHETILAALAPDLTNDALGTTETANGLRFAQLFGEIARYAEDEERWVLWNGTRWELDSPGSLRAFGLTLGVVRAIREEALDASDEPGPNNSPSPRALLLKHAARSESVASRRATLAAAAGIPELQTTVEHFDSDHTLLGCDDQVLDLRGKVVQVRPVRRADMLTRTTGVRYNPARLAEDPPPLMRRYIDTFIQDPIRERLLFKALGTCLVGGNSHRLFIIIQGESTTGKTQLVEAIYSALGRDYATIGTASVFRGNLDDKPRPDILKAISRRVAFFSEASKAWELHADRVKDLTGAGTITARRMRSNDFIDVKPNFTPVLVTNALPRIIGADDAVLRRMLLFDFNHRPTLEDTTIRDKFVNSVEVREWLLARLVRGYEESVMYGIQDILVAQGIATMNGFDNLTHLGAFLRWLVDTDQLVQIPEEERGYGVKSTYATLKETYDRYSLWVKDYGSKKDSAEKLDYESFNDQLRNNGWERIKSGAWRWEGKRLMSLLTLISGVK